MNKRGLEPVSVIGVLILVVIFGWIAMSFTERAIRGQQNVLDKSLCEQSIIAASANKVPDFNKDACKPNRVNLTKEYIIKKYDLNDDASNREIDPLVKKEIAELMFDCASTVSLEDDLNPYPTDRKMNYVFICSIINFEDIKPFSGLTLWMTNHKPPRNEKTYFEIFNKKKPTEDEIEEFAKMEDVYVTSKEYTIVWEKGFAYRIDNRIVNDAEADACRVTPICVVTLGIKEMEGEIYFKPYSELIPVSPIITTDRERVIIMN